MKNEKVCFNKSVGVAVLVVGILAFSAYIGYSISQTTTSTSSRASFSENNRIARNTITKVQGTTKQYGYDCTKTPSWLQSALQFKSSDLNIAPSTSYDNITKTHNQANKNKLFIYDPDLKNSCTSGDPEDFKTMKRCAGKTLQIWQYIVPPQSSTDLTIGYIKNNDDKVIITLPYCKILDVQIPSDVKPIGGVYYWIGVKLSY